MRHLKGNILVILADLSPRLRFTYFNHFSYVMYSFLSFVTSYAEETSQKHI